MGNALTVTATASDDDGRVARIDLDLDGDGSYETGVDGATLQPSRSTTKVTYSRAARFQAPGGSVVRARVTDDAGATTSGAGTVRVTKTGDATPLPPAFPRMGVVKYVGAYGSRCVTPEVSPGATLSFDLDGDGAFDDVPTYNASSELYYWNVNGDSTPSHDRGQGDGPGQRRLVGPDARAHAARADPRAAGLPLPLQRPSSSSRARTRTSSCSPASG